MSQQAVLQDATPEQLVQAAALNHRELFCLQALSSGGEVQTADGVTWTWAGPQSESMVAFPALPAERAGEQLDEIVGYYLCHGPRSVGCWSLDPPQPPDLGVLLLARGFQPGWRPCWMALDLRTAKTDHPLPAGLRIEADRTTSLLDVPDLPYANPGDVALLARYPLRVRRYVATLDGNVVAHSMVLLTTGPYGTAGIYSVGVVPGARNRGVGKAVTLASCLYAKEHGYTYAVLNATGRRMYEQLGFVWVGDGWTWWLKGARLAAQPPKADQVALAEAVGRGDVAALDRLGSGLNGVELDKPLTNGMSLLQLAAHCAQPAAAEWLVAHGATLQVLTAWDLGWKDRAARLLSNDPGQVDHLYGEWRITLLHEAASRDDAELARLALSAHPNLDIKDTAFNSTPLGWARHLQREAIVRLIEAHTSG